MSPLLFLVFFARSGVLVVAPRDPIQDAIMFQLTVVVIEVGWWCWPYNERWYAGDRVVGKYTEQTRDDGSGTPIEGCTEGGGKQGKVTVEIGERSKDAKN